jgi:hypothetical protein
MMRPIEPEHVTGRAHSFDAAQANAIGFSEKTMNDRGIWITWYDLPQQGRERYFSWLYGTYIPQILAKPGVLWAAHYENTRLAPLGHIRHTTDPAVPTGNDYVLMFGAETAHAFSKGFETFTRGAPSKFAAALSATDREMLASRRGERVVITTEEARVDGPDAGIRGGKLTPSPCIQLGSFNAATRDEDELLAWYADWRMEAMSKLPGCVGMRKLVSVSGWAKHLVMYEFASVDDRARNLPSFKSLYPEQMKWTEEWIPKLTHAPESPLVCRRAWPEN